MISQILGICVIENIDKYDKWLDSVNFLREATCSQLLKLKLTAYKSNEILFYLKLTLPNFF